jgi:hypothetical protein
MTPKAAVSRSAAVALAGALLSGPMAIGIVNVVHPQPRWKDAATFAVNFHPIQSLPYFAGLLLVGGLVALVTALHGLANADLRARTRWAAALSAAFAAMVFCNYAIQTTFVPALVAAAERDSLALAGNLTMANPASLGWALEMWGYGVLGVATWLAAPVFADRRFGATTAALFVANGPVSIAGALASALVPGWVLTPAGLWAFGLWNALLAALLVGAIAAMRSPEPQPDGPT